jgi:hypothetical protein
MKGTLKIVVTNKDAKEVSKMEDVVATEETNVYLIPEKLENVLQAKKIAYAVISPGGTNKEEEK